MLAWMVLQVPLALFPGPTPPTCQLEVLSPTALEERVLRDFDQQVALYVRLHRRLERALHLSRDFENIPVAIDELHAALVDARPLAREGGLFTPAVAGALTRRLERAITSVGLTPAEALIAMRHGYQRAIPELRVNDRFTDIRHVHVWPALLAVLPTLPHELVYRLVGRDLVVVDLHADLVVDILRDALPAPAWSESYSAAPRVNPRNPQRRDAVNNRFPNDFTPRLA